MKYLRKVLLLVVLLVLCASAFTAQAAPPAPILATYPWDFTLSPGSPTATFDTHLPWVAQVTITGAVADAFAVSCSNGVSFNANPPSLNITLITPGGNIHCDVTLLGSTGGSYHFSATLSSVVTVVADPPADQSPVYILCRLSNPMGWPYMHLSETTLKVWDQPNVEVDYQGVVFHYDKTQDWSRVQFVAGSYGQPLAYFKVFGDGNCRWTNSNGDDNGLNWK